MTNSIISFSAVYNIFVITFQHIILSVNLTNASFFLKKTYFNKIINTGFFVFYHKNIPTSFKTNTFFSIKNKIMRVIIQRAS